MKTMKKLLFLMLLMAAPYATAYKEVCAMIINTTGNPVLNFEGKAPQMWHFEYDVTSTYMRQPAGSNEMERLTSTDKTCYITLDSSELSALLDNLKKFSDDTLVSKTYFPTMTLAARKSGSETPLEKAQEAVKKAGGFEWTVGELKEKLNNPKRQL